MVAEDSSKHLSVPAIDVVGTWDDLVVSELRRTASRSSRGPSTGSTKSTACGTCRATTTGSKSFQYVASRMKLDPDVARAMGEGPLQIPTVREAFDWLVRWVTSGEVPPPSQTVAPGRPLK